MLPQGRISGVLLPLFSLRGKHDFGIGDFGCAEGLFRWMKSARQRMWMVLPLLPTAPGDSSPYSTRSAFGLNPLFIDLEALPELAESGGTGALPDESRRTLDAVRAAPSIRYDAVVPLKAAALRQAFGHFLEHDWKTQSARAKQVASYRDEQRDWLDALTLYSALSREQGLRGWWDWPQELRERRPQAIAEARRRLEREILFEAWQQWVAEEQWKKVRALARQHEILLCGDEPFIVGQDSADCWANPHLLRRDARLGVPPDDFSATGQDWGLPYFDFAAMEREDHAWLRRRAQKSAAYYDLRRVDHAVGYFRQWIRDEATPLGRFLPQDEAAQRALGEKLFRILLAPGAGILAEDLGVVPDFVRQSLTALGIPGYRVLRWERDGGTYRDPRQFPALSVVTTGTHDTETLREWWERLPPHERDAMASTYPALRAAGPLEPFSPQVHQALLTVAEASSSNICILPWQDVLGSRDRINLPGTVGDSNWTYRIADATSDLLVSEEPKRGAQMLARASEAAGR